MLACLHIALYSGDGDEGRGQLFRAARAFFFRQFIYLFGKVDHRVAFAVSELSDELGDIGLVVAGINIESDRRKALYALTVAYNGDIFSHRSHAAFL